MTRPAQAADAPSGSWRSGVRRRGALAVDLVVLVVLVVLLPQTLDLASSARRFPLIMNLLLIALVLLDAAIETFPAVRRRTGFLESDLVDVGSGLEVPDDEGEPLDVPEVGTPRFRVLTVPQALGWLTGLGAAMYFVGYVYATPVFLALFFLWARVPVKVAVSITVVMTCLNYYVFYEYLGLR